MVKKNITAPIKETIIPKIIPKKTITTPKIPKKPVAKKKAMTKTELEQALLNNFINLQKVLTNLSVKFDLLSDNISKLLQLFEISAKSFAEKYSEKQEEGTGQDKNLSNKLDSLLDQNKIIAKGIMMMEERIRQGNTPTQTKREERFERMLKSKSSPRY